MKVLVVGGLKSLIRGKGGRGALDEGNLAQRLAAHGIEVGWHIAEAVTLDCLPVGCEGVILIKDSCNHPFHNAVRSLTSAAQLPLARISRKWGHAEPVLRLEGFIQAADESAPAPEPGEVSETARSLVIEIRQQGRDPCFEEIETAIRRAFGPKAEFPLSQYRQLHAQAAVMVPLPEKPEAPAGPDSEDLLAGATAIMEERPEVLIDDDHWRSSMADLLGAETQVPDAVYAQARAVFLDQMAVLGKTPEGRAERNQQMAAWASRYYAAESAAGRQPPVYATILRRSKAIFGIRIPREVLLGVRADAHDGQAHDLLALAPAYRYYRATAEAAGLVPMPEETFRALVADGKVWGNLRHTSDGRHWWFTSKTAIEALVQSAVPEQVEAPEYEPEVVAPPAPEPVTLETLAALVREQNARLARIEARLETLSAGTPMSRETFCATLRTLLGPEFSPVMSKGS